jgi:CubicO group peptidase (beta-lactamase class C family)
MLWKRFFTVLLVFGFLVASTSVTFEGSSAAQADVVRDYWPTDLWTNATPQSVGMDPVRLNRIDETIMDDDIGIDSVVIVKNGYIVYEKYYHYWNQHMAHTIQSCTKSFMSALIGIAIDMGYIDNVSQPILDFFPGYTIDNRDARKENITLFHCLTMSSGLEFHETDIPYEDPENDLFAMYRSGDMWQYVLDRPMEKDPGEEWSYNSGGIELLGGAIEYATGYEVADFAEQFLFDPIGIDYYRWWREPNSGQYGCGGGLDLLPRDMARFGFLYLNNGTWNDTQVVSSEWVDFSTNMYYNAGSWYHYGCTWWGIPGYGFYQATGHYEQKIYVLPEEDMVVVFTGDIQDEDWHPTDWFVVQCVMPAIVDTGNGIDPIVIVGVSIFLALVLPPPILYIRHRAKR